ncbi:MAG: response regulator [Acidobacteria bacterium]|nr:response regulator [Acidobacteriota bacterium]
MPPDPVRPRSKGWRRGALWLTLAILSAQGATAQRYHIRNFTPEEGLPAAQIFALHQDAKGYVWTGSPGGLSRYDGVGFTTFSQADGLEDQSIKVILSDEQGRLWFGANEGVTVFDGRRFTQYGRDSGIGAGRISSGAIDRFGTVWFATQEGGLSAFVEGRFRTYTGRDGLPDDDVFRVFADSRGRLWISTRNSGIAVATCEPNGRLSDLRIFTKADGLPHDTIRAFAEDREGNIYIGTRGAGISRYDGHSFANYDRSHGLSSGDVLNLLVSRQGELVIGTYDRGITICSLPSLDSCRQITRENGLQEDSVLSLMEDRDGHLWFGLNYGISELVDEKFASFTEKEGLVNNTVYAVFPDVDDSVWFGTFRGVSRLRFDGQTSNPEWTHLRGDGVLPSNEVWDIRRDRGGRLWIGTSLGLCLYSETIGCRTFTTRHGMVDDYILDLHEDAHGNLWLGTGGGVSMIAADSLGPRPQFKNYTPADGLPAKNIYAIAEDKKGRMWFGAQAQGLAVLDRGTIKVYGKNDGLRSDGIAALYAARDGSVWVGTRGGGLARYRDAAVEEKAFISFGARSGILADTVQAIAEDQSGRLWLGTNRGVYLIDPSRADRDDAPNMVLEHYETTDGLADNASSTMNGIAFDRAGNLWLGFSRGATVYRPAFERKAPSPPQVDIVQVSVRGGPRLPSLFSTAEVKEPVQWLNDALPPLPHDRNDIRFDFRALRFAGGEQIRYQHRLEGFEQAWSDESMTPFKEYTNLSAGEYRFLVRGRSGDGSWSGEPARFAFVVLPPFWQTWWARSIAVLLGAILILAMHKLRTRAIVVRNRELEGVVAARTAQLAEYSHRLEEHANELERANEKIIAADETKTRFFTTMSHELRTPLNSIIGFSEILTTRLGERASAREMGFIQNVLESGRHLLNLINNLLDLSKIEEGKMEVHVDDVVMSELVDGVTSMLEAIASRRRIELMSNVAPDLPEQRIDAAKLKQILYNLLSNAIKFSPDGSKIEIGVRLLAGNASPLGADSVEVSVTDHGPGIPLALQQLIFEEFRQTATGAKSEGTGLGLAIVRKLAEIQGGRVSVESQVGVGSTFRVVIPSMVTEILLHDSISDEVTVAAQAGKPHTILIVEDDAEFAASLRENLEAAGFRTVSTRRGEEVLRLARDICPSTITLDLLLPGVDGWEVLRQLKSDPTCSKVPVVIISAFGDRELGVALGADEQFEKPLDHTMLLARIRELLPADGKRSETILVIDDDASVQQVLKSTLGEAGYEVICTGSGDAGVRLASSVHPALIVLDLMMPEVNPFEVAARIQGDPSTRSIPLVILTPRELGLDVRDQLLHKMKAQLERGAIPTSRVAETIRELDRRQSTRPSSHPDPSTVEPTRS